MCMCKCMYVSMYVCMYVCMYLLSQLGADVVVKEKQDSDDDGLRYVCMYV